MNIHRLLAGTLSIILVVGIGTPVFAQLQTPQVASTGEPNRPLVNEDNVIFNGGTSDFDAGGQLDVPNRALLFAEDFELEVATKLRDVHLDVFQDDPGFTASFTYTVYADAGGVPGALIQAGQGINEGKVAIVDGFGSSFRYWFDLDTPLPLDADTRYWIELHAMDTPGDFHIYWWTTTPGFGNPLVASFDDGITWESQEPFQVNLVLTGGDDVVGGEFLPIDSTALLVAGAQTNAVWILSALAVIGSVAFGTLYITTRRN